MDLENFIQLPLEGMSKNGEADFIAAYLASHNHPDIIPRIDAPVRTIERRHHVIAVMRKQLVDFFRGSVARDDVCRQNMLDLIEYLGNGCADAVYETERFQHLVQEKIPLIGDV